MKKLLFAAIGIAAAVYAVKKLCYGKDYCSGDNCEECGYCDEAAGNNAAISEETAENDANSAENTGKNNEN